MHMTTSEADPGITPGAMTLPSEELVRSRKRVVDHGEVFTPSWMVENMLNLVSAETSRIDSRFLEPACGSGNFLKSVLRRKFETVEVRYGKSEFEKKHYALFSLMSIYGIELLKDNLDECRENLLQVFIDFINVSREDVWSLAAQHVLRSNILQGDALSLTKADGLHIEFPEWGYLGAGKFQRRDFRFDALTQRSSIKGTLFEYLEEEELFVPTKTYAPMRIEDMAK
jgi:N-6 DNA Methylase